jgi:PIN like domain
LINSVVFERTKKFEELEHSEHLSLDDALINDPILAAFERLLDGKIGSKPSDDERNSRITEALKRQKLKQPPGYKDVDKDTDELKAGDYLLWAELLEYAKSSESTTPIMFVTGDVKEDWFERIKEKTIGPRIELKREFASTSARPYYQQNLESFLHNGNRFLNSEVSVSAISEATTISPSNDSLRLYQTYPAIVEALAEWTHPNKLGINEAFDVWNQQNRLPITEILAAWNQQNRLPITEALAAWNQQNRLPITEALAAWNQQNRLTMIDAMAEYFDSIRRTQKPEGEGIDDSPGSCDK